MTPANTIAGDSAPQGGKAAGAEAPIRFEGRVFLIFLSLACVLCLDLLVLGPYALYQQHDVFDFMFSEIGKARAFWTHGGIGWWTDSGGLPSFMAHQPPYPLHLLLAGAAPAWLVYTLWRVIGLTAAGYGMFQLLRQFLNATRRASFLGGFLFVSSMLAFELVNVPTALFPCLILFCSWLLRPGQTRLGALAAALGLVCITATSLHPGPLALAFAPTHLLLLLLFAPRTNLRRELAAFFLFWGCFTLMVLPWVYGTGTNIASTGRALDPREVYTLPYLLSSLSDISVQQTFPAAFLLFMALPQALGQGRTRRLLLIGLFPAALLVLRHSPIFALLIGTPLESLSGINPVMFMLPYFFTVCFAFAGVADQWMRAGRRVNYIWVAVLLAVFAALNRGEYFLRLAMLLLFTLSLLELSRPNAGRQRLLKALCVTGATGMVLTGFVFHILLSMHVPFVRGFGPMPALAPMEDELARGRPFRVASLFVDGSVLSSHGLEDLSGGRVLFVLQSYRELMQRIPRDSLFASTKEREAFRQNGYRLDLFPTPLGASTHLGLNFKPGRRLTAGDWNLDLARSLGTRYLVSGAPLEGLEGSGVTPVSAPRPEANPESRRFLDRLNRFYDLPLWVYRLEGDFGRGYLARAAQVSDTRQGSLDALAAASLGALRTTAYFAREDLGQSALPELPGPEQADGPVADGEAADGQVALVRAVPDQWVFRVEAPGPRLLLVANNFHAGWQATLNGAAVPVLRANHTLQAVGIPAAGSYEVRLAFRDPLLWKLHWLAGLGALLLLAVPALLPRMRPQQPGAAEQEPLGPLVRTREPWLVGAGFVVLWTVGFALFDAKGERMFSPEKPCFYLLGAAPAVALAFLAWFWSSSRLLGFQDKGRDGGP